MKSKPNYKDITNYKHTLNLQKSVLGTYLLGILLSLPLAYLMISYGNKTMDMALNCQSDHINKTLICN